MCVLQGWVCEGEKNNQAIVYLNEIPKRDGQGRKV